MKTLLCLIASSALALPLHAALTSQLGILDLNGNGGINPATGVAWQAGDTYRLVFVTEGTIDATSTDINTYNTFIQNAANSSTTYANLNSVTWKAIASTTTVNARDNTGTNTSTLEAIFLINGTTVVANNYADMWDGAVTNRILNTENNVARQGNFANTAIWGSWTAIWTGTASNGTTSNELGTTTARHGIMKDSTNMWVSRNTADNSYSLPMYGLSQSLAVVPEPSTFGLIGLSGLLLIRRRR